MNRTSVFSFSLLLLGCAAQPEVETPVALSAAPAATYDAVTLQQIKGGAEAVVVDSTLAPPESERVVCVREASVGSSIKRRVCYTRAGLQRQAEETQQWLNDELAVTGTVRDSAPIR